jgi:hypothetical protein
MPLASLMSGLGLRVGIALAATVAVLAVLVGARNVGRQAERVDALKQTLKNAETRRDVEDDVRRSGAGAAGRLRDGWSRD